MHIEHSYIHLLNYAQRRQLKHYLDHQNEVEKEYRKQFRKTIVESMKGR